MEEYEEMKDANAVRRLSRPDTDLERAVLEIVKKTISKRRDNKGVGTSDHAPPPPSLNGRRLSGENEPPRIVIMSFHYFNSTDFTGV